MNTHKPLKAKTSLKALSGLVNKTKIKPMSTKRKEENVVYLKDRASFLLDNVLCECCLQKPVGSVVNLATDLHHKKGRGKYYLDQTYWCALCRPCHQKISIEKDWAKENGWRL